MKPLPMTEIKTIQDVVKFFAHLIGDESLNFHPDDPFTDYVDKDNKPSYTTEEANERTRLLDECFAICQAEHRDIYAADIRLAAARYNITFTEKGTEE